MKEIKITKNNINDWPIYKKLYVEGMVVFDNNGTLRYPHGAPVGNMIFVRRGKDGEPIYKESADEWFDPDSQAAQNFVWPK